MQIKIKKTKKPGRESFQMPEEDRPRLTRSELDLMIRMFNFMSAVAYSEETMTKRLALVPDGEARMKKAMDELHDVLEDLHGTVPFAQRRKLSTAYSDFEVRLLPKLTPHKAVTTLTKEEGHALIDAAQDGRCYACTKDGEECKKCPLQMVLSAVVPLDDYGGILCPYNMAMHKWKD